MGQLCLATDHSRPLTFVTRVLTQTITGTLGERLQSAGGQHTVVGGCLKKNEESTKPGEWNTALWAEADAG